MTKFNIHHCLKTSGFDFFNLFFGFRNEKIVKFISMFGFAASIKEGRRPFRASPYKVNCETTSSSPSMSSKDKIHFVFGIFKNSQIQRFFQNIKSFFFRIFSAKYRAKLKFLCRFRRQFRRRPKLLRVKLFE